MVEGAIFNKNVQLKKKISELFISRKLHIKGESWKRLFLPEHGNSVKASLLNNGAHENRTKKQRFPDQFEPYKYPNFLLWKQVTALPGVWKTYMEDSLFNYFMNNIQHF